MKTRGKCRKKDADVDFFPGRQQKKEKKEMDLQEGN
jgi:hypothetical protein